MEVMAAQANHNEITDKNGMESHPLMQSTDTTRFHRPASQRSAAQNQAPCGVTESSSVKRRKMTLYA